MPDRIIEHMTRKLPEASPWSGLTYRGLLARKRQEVGIEPPSLPDSSIVRGEIQAYISSGRWVVSCPDCYTAVLLDKQDLVFSCPGCGTDGSWRRVVLPADLQEIERLLLLRPGWHENSPHRNWFPSETVQDLRAQNIANGAPI